MDHGLPNPEIIETSEQLQAHRLSILSRHIDLTQTIGLEIGPLCRPLVTPECVSPDGRIEYLDHLDRDGLRQKYKDDPQVNIDQIVSVDHICDDGDLSSLDIDRPFDYIVASHVVEHIPDLLSWFDNIGRLLRPGGILFLAVPDKRFTFDYVRPVSTPGQYVETNLLGRKRPTIKDVFDHHALITNTHGGEVWQGQYDDDKLLFRNNPLDAYNLSKEALAPERYIDVHVGVFTSTSFISLVKIFISIKRLFFKIAGFYDVSPNQIEFYVVFQRPEESEGIETLLASIPSLQSDTFQAKQNQMMRYFTESLHKIATRFNEQDHQINMQEHAKNLITLERDALAVENARLKEKIGDIDDRTMSIYRSSRIVRYALKISKWCGHQKAKIRGMKSKNG